MTQKIPPHHICSICSHANEPPWVFCSQCGAPRIRLGRWRVTFDLSLIGFAFLGTYLYRDFLSWSWPLYALWAFLFTEFAAALVKGELRKVTRVWIWCASLFAAVFLLNHIAHHEGADTLIYGLAAVPDLARAYPLIFFPAVGAALVAIFVPCYFRWARLYGWVNAYRIVVLAALVLSLVGVGVLRVVRWIWGRDLFPALATALEDFLAGAAVDYGRYLDLFAISAFRLFLFEIFVFAAVRGYAVVRGTRSAKLSTDTVGASGFTRSLLHLALALRRLAHVIENMVRYLSSTLVLLAQDLAQVGLAFARELLVPTVALLISGGLALALTSATMAYIDHNTVRSMVEIVGATLGLILCALIFLACKSHFRWGRVVTFYSQLISWLLPNLLVFFLLMSLSLWASSEGLNRFDPDTYSLPFRLGALTKVVAGLLVLLIVVIFVRKRSMLFAPHPEPEAAAVQKPETGPEPATTTEAAPETPRSKGLLWHRWIGRQAGSVAGAAVGRTRSIAATVGRKTGATRHVSAATGAAADLTRSAVSSLGLGDHLRHARERLKGKPKVVIDLEHLRARQREKQAQLDALESTRESIAAETFENLLRMHRRELTELEERIAPLQVELNRLHADNLTEIKRLEDKIGEIRDHRAELDKLLEVGALSQSDHRKRSSPLQREIETASLQLQACQRMDAFLAPEASPASES